MKRREKTLRINKLRYFSKAAVIGALVLSCAACTMDSVNDGELPGNNIPISSTSGMGNKDNLNNGLSDTKELEGVYLRLDRHVYSLASDERVCFSAINSTGESGYGIVLAPKLEVYDDDGTLSAVKCIQGFCGTPDSLSKELSGCVELEWYEGLKAGKYKLTYTVLKYSGEDYFDGLRTEVSDDFILIDDEIVKAYGEVLEVNETASDILIASDSTLLGDRCRVSCKDAEILLSGGESTTISAIKPGDNLVIYGSNFVQETYPTGWSAFSVEISDKNIESLE